MRYMYWIIGISRLLDPMCLAFYCNFLLGWLAASAVLTNNTFNNLKQKLMLDKIPSLHTANLRTLSQA